VAGALCKLGLLLGGERFNDPGGRSHHQRAVGDFLVLCDQAVGADQAVFTYFGAIENYCIDANQ